MQLDLKFSGGINEDVSTAQADQVLTMRDWLLLPGTHTAQTRSAAYNFKHTLPGALFRFRPHLLNARFWDQSKWRHFVATSDGGIVDPALYEVTWDSIGIPNATRVMRFDDISQPVILESGEPIYGLSYNGDIFLINAGRTFGHTGGFHTCYRHTVWIRQGSPYGDGLAWEDTQVSEWEPKDRFPNCGAATVQSAYMVCGNVHGDGQKGASTIRWSLPNDPTHWRDRDFFQVQPTDGDYISGLWVFHDMLMVFKSKTVYLLTGTPGAYSELGIIHAGDGCPWPETIQEYEGCMVWMASDKHLRVWSGQGSAVKISEPALRESAPQWRVSHKAVATTWPDKLSDSATNGWTLTDVRFKDTATKDKVILDPNIAAQESAVTFPSGSSSLNPWNNCHAIMQEFGRRLETPGNQKSKFENHIYINGVRGTFDFTMGSSTYTGYVELQALDEMYGNSDGDGRILATATFSITSNNPSFNVTFSDGVFIDQMGRSNDWLRIKVYVKNLSGELQTIRISHTNYVLPEKPVGLRCGYVDQNGAWGNWDFSEAGCSLVAVRPAPIFNTLEVYVCDCVSAGSITHGIDTSGHWPIEVSNLLSWDRVWWDVGGVSNNNVRIRLRASNKWVDLPRNPGCRVPNQFRNDTKLAWDATLFADLAGQEYGISPEFGSFAISYYTTSGEYHVARIPCAVVHDSRYILSVCSAAGTANDSSVVMQAEEIGAPGTLGTSVRPIFTTWSDVGTNHFCKFRRVDVNYELETLAWSTLAAADEDSMYMLDPFAWKSWQIATPRPSPLIQTHRLIVAPTERPIRAQFNWLTLLGTDEGRLNVSLRHGQLCRIVLRGDPYVYTVPNTGNQSLRYPEATYDWSIDPSAQPDIVFDKGLPEQVHIPILTCRTLDAQIIGYASRQSRLRGVAVSTDRGVGDIASGSGGVS